MPKIFKQSGITLILFLVLLVLGLSAFVLSKIKNRTDWMLENQAQTARVLRQAKEALIGFAATYAETHPGQPQGYLPCPDHDGDGSASTCGTQGHSVIGRFPWKTMGLPPLRDGSGECLWYAVSGTYKDNPKKVLTSNADGLFIVRNTSEDMITGGKIVSKDDLLDTSIDTEIDQAIAVIFAPGKPLKNQTRATTNTECGDGALPDDYLDDYKLNGTVYDNAKGTGTLSSNGNAANFWVTTSLTQTPEFISAPLTYGTHNGKVNTGEVIFNDTLMLITPKDYAPVYKRMEFWVAERVTQCLRNYGKLNRDNFFKNMPDTAISKYRSDHAAEINTYVNLMEAKYRAYFHKEHHIDENTAPEPTSADVENVRKIARENAIDINSQYPWATPVNDLTYTDKAEQRFGRIPKEMPQTHTDNPKMEPDWKDTLYEGKVCFNEGSSLLNDYEWGWWKEWKEMVFYVVDDDNVPNQAHPRTHIWVKAINTKDNNGWVKWVGWLEAPFNDEPKIDDYNGLDEITFVNVQKIKKDTFAKKVFYGGWILRLAPAETPSSSSTLQLGNSNQWFEDAQFVVLVAGRRLLLNLSRPSLDEDLNEPYPRYQQKRRVGNDEDKKIVKNYLEGRAEPLVPLDPVSYDELDLDDPLHDPRMLRKTTKIDGEPFPDKLGGNIPHTGESDQIPSIDPIASDKRFIRKPIVPNYFNDVSCMNKKHKYGENDDTDGCKIPRR